MGLVEHRRHNDAVIDHALCANCAGARRSSVRTAAALELRNLQPNYQRRLARNKRSGLAKFGEYPSRSRSCDFAPAEMFINAPSFPLALESNIQNPLSSRRSGRRNWNRWSQEPLKRSGSTPAFVLDEQPSVANGTAGASCVSGYGGFDGIRRGRTGVSTVVMTDAEPLITINLKSNVKFRHRTGAQVKIGDWLLKIKSRSGKSCNIGGEDPLCMRARSARFGSTSPEKHRSPRR